MRALIKMAMDYKNTLNLPRTDFSMKADLVVREPQRLAQWLSGKLYERIQARRAGAPKFVLHDGPPFANGDVHIGTALNKILMDIIVKYKSLCGFSAPYIPGWDCHGLPIEFKVSQEMRKAGDTASDPAAIRKACDAYARKFIDIQRQQFKRLGVLGDWENPYLTLNKEYEADELRLFADIVEQGFVYRGKKPVYWSIPCRTALAEAEVEYKDHVSQSVYVKFPVIGRPGVFILIWTTTPWTLPANLAIAYNKDFSYSLVRVGADEHIVSTMLLGAVAQKCKWESYEIVRSLDAGLLTTVEYQHPFCDRTGKLYPAEFVENSTGTGFVHIAPGHGLEDYGLGSSVGLPIYSPVDDDGRLALTSDLPVEQQMPAELVGKSILEKNGKSDANEAVIELLQSKNALVFREGYSHSYPHCWRSKTPVIFRAMDQWFIEIDHARAGKTFREESLDAINGVAWVPDWGKNRIEAAVKGRPDWCISRQRTWGVPIPAFYDAQGNAILDARVVRKTAALFEQHGSNVWFEKSAQELWSLVKPGDWTSADAVAKSSDTLDVWIDSGSSSRSVLRQRAELSHSGGYAPHSVSDWQADIYLEGSDQHRGWFQSSLLLSLAGNGAAPFKTVLTHGFMVDADREKISKSKQGQGGYEKPQTAEAYVGKWGADVVRLWVASQDYRTDIVVSEERVNKVSETYRNIRNTLRYQLSNLYDFDPAKHTVADAQLTPLDAWLLGKFAMLETEVAAAYDAYEFHVVYQKIAQFVSVELSAIYHDLVKDRLYTDPANSTRRRSTQTALHRVVSSLCQMLAPVLVFTADEAWELIPGNVGTSVHATDWKPSQATVLVDQATWANLFAIRDQALAELEKARQAKTIGKSLEAKLIVEGKAELVGIAQQNLETLREILNVSQLEARITDAATFAVTVAKADGVKCERCWHFETDVGSDAAHPTLCARCAKAVREFVPVT
ncbi:MAG TPA: isoleucine--tRNA ligase [Verrucomicrobiae bacterium]|nr:isoleucine--tRNA ligase [Verrucomicrobiae bacterium]